MKQENIFLMKSRIILLTIHFFIATFLNKTVYVQLTRNTKNITHLFTELKDSYSYLCIVCLDNVDTRLHLSVKVSIHLQIILRPYGR